MKTTSAFVTLVEIFLVMGAWPASSMLIGGAGSDSDEYFLPVLTAVVVGSALLASLFLGLFRASIGIVGTAPMFALIAYEELARATLGAFWRRALVPSGMLASTFLSVALAIAFFASRELASTLSGGAFDSILLRALSPRARRARLHVLRVLAIGALVVSGLLVVRGATMHASQPDLQQLSSRVAASSACTSDGREAAVVGEVRFEEFTDEHDECTLAATGPDGEREPIRRWLLDLGLARRVRNPACPRVCVSKGDDHLWFFAIQRDHASTLSVLHEMPAGSGPSISFGRAQDDALARIVSPPHAWLLTALAGVLVAIASVLRRDRANEARLAWTELTVAGSPMLVSAARPGGMYRGSPAAFDPAFAMPGTLTDLRNQIVDTKAARWAFALAVIVLTAAPLVRAASMGML